MRVLQSLVSLLLLVPALLFAQTVPPPPPANPLLVGHRNWFVPANIWDVQKDPKLAPFRPPGLTYKAYSAVGYSLANTIAIVGPTNEIVIIDTLENVQNVNDAIAAFRAQGAFPATGKLPIRAIIYTHNHIDHIGGVQAYLSAATMPPCVQQVNPDTGNDQPLNADALNCVSVIGQENIVDGVNNTATVIGTIINGRSGYMYGGLIPESWRVTNGIGLKVSEGTSTFVMPSRTFASTLELQAAGVNMELVYVPSETNDELAAFIPDKSNGGAAGSTSGLLQSAEVLQGPAFPNLYSLRGTSYRSAATWYRSVDKLRKYNSWCMLPSHGTPLCGQQNIETLMRNFRDAIQYTHDQSVRFMNNGYTMDQLPVLIKMPQYLIDDLSTIQTAKSDTDPRDYLRPFYGSVPQALRELYAGYLGWFQADPVALNPTPPQEYATRIVAMIGADKLHTSIDLALVNGQSQWAAEMANLLVTANPKDQAARNQKASAFMKLAEPELNPNWRNWYLTAANELRNIFPRADTPAFAGGLTAPGIVAAMPYDDWVGQFSLRLKAEETIAGNVNRKMGLYLGPASPNQTAQGYVLDVRRGVAELISTGSDRGEVAVVSPFYIEMSKDTQVQLVNANVAGKDYNFPTVLSGLLASGAIKVNGGTQANVESFFALFERPPATQPVLAAR
jgi:alkyl sulfatase BDS1-like metallo-beta-lactamase superfamily hydrolase